MDSNREARLNMYHRIIDLCENNLAIVALVLAFQTSYNVFKTTVTAIVAGMTDLEAQTGGHATSKKTAKRNLATMGSGIAGMVYAYAVVIGDELLQGAMQISFSKINKALDDQVVLICNNIYTAANDNIANLGDYGVTAPLLATFQTAIDDYENKSPKPEQSAAYKKAVLQQIKIMDKDASNVLKKQMDKLAVNFRSNGNEAFELQYRADRLITDAGSFSTVLKILAVNGANHAPLTGVKSYRDSSPVVKKSTVKGFITYKDIEQGSHNFVLKLKGFEDLELNEVMMAHGEKKTVNAVMIVGSGSPGFKITEFHIPPGGSILYPFSGGGNSIPPTLEIYFVCINGNAVICTTDLPANACTAGFQLLQGILFHGAISGLGLDLSKTNIQITNPGLNVITVWAGVKESGE